MITALPKVSVITPFHNDSRYIMECVESVQNSSYPNIEHIIIDDGSTEEGCSEIFNKISKYNNITVIRTANQGVCLARNQAISSSSGDFILPLDSDDKISCEYIEIAAKVLQNNPNITLVATNYQQFGKKNETVDIGKFSMERLLGCNFIVNCSMYRRSDFDKTLGYNPNMSEGLEDWDFLISLLKRGGEVECLEGVNFFYRIKENYLSRNASVDYETEDKLLRQIWVNNSDAFQSYYPNPIYSIKYIRIENELNMRSVVKKTLLSRLWLNIKTSIRQR